MLVFAVSFGLIVFIVRFFDGRCFQGSRGGIEAGKLEYVRS